MTKTRLISIFLLLIGTGLIIFTSLNAMVYGVVIVVISCVLELFASKKRSK